MLKKLIQNNFFIFFACLAVLLLGFFGFWHYRDAVFSGEVLQLTISAPSTAAMGNEITYTVTYKNNGNFVLEEPKLVFELPDNSLTEDSKTRIEKNIKNIYPGEEGFVIFKTRLLGKEGDIKTAQASLSYMPHNLSARYESNASATTTVATVDMNLTFDLPATLQQKQQLVYSINYLSNIDYPLENLSIKVDPVPGLTITSADPASLDNAEWKLDILQKGQGGTLKIIGMIAPDAPTPMVFSARLGMRVNGMFVVVKSVIQNVQVPQSQTSISEPISQKVYYTSQNGIDNIGPIPPNVGSTTTYAVVWQVANNSRAVKNVAIQAVLPAGVSLNDNVFPEDQGARLSFDNASRKVTWLAGDLAPGASPLLTFQIALTSDASMQGKLAPLIGQAVVSGQDQTTGMPLTGSAPAVDSSLPDDVANSGKGIVQ